MGGGTLRGAHPWIAWDYNESVHQGRCYQEIFKLAKANRTELTTLHGDTAKPVTSVARQPGDLEVAGSSPTALHPRRTVALEDIFRVRPGGTLATAEHIRHQVMKVSRPRTLMLASVMQ